MSSSRERAERFARALEEGVPVEQIAGLLNMEAVLGALSREGTPKGIDSVNRTVETISGLPVVNGVEKTKKDSYADTTGKDLIIDINKRFIQKILGIDTKLQHVFVQVKSSEGGIKHFKEKFGKTDDEQNRELLERRLIVINGQDPPEIISDKFLGQLKRVLLHHAEK